MWSNTHISTIFALQMCPNTNILSIFTSNFYSILIYQRIPQSYFVRTCQTSAVPWKQSSDLQTKFNSECSHSKCKLKKKLRFYQDSRFGPDFRFGCGNRIWSSAYCRTRLWIWDLIFKLQDSDSGLEIWFQYTFDFDSSFEIHFYKFLIRI